MGVPQNLLMFLSNLAQRAFVEPAPKTASNLEHLEAQRNALLEKVARSRNR